MIGRPLRSVLSPLHAMLDERVMEFTLVNYNLINVPDLILRTFTTEKKHNTNTQEFQGRGKTA